MIPLLSIHHASFSDYKVDILASGPEPAIAAEKLQSHLILVIIHNQHSLWDKSVHGKNLVIQFAKMDHIGKYIRI